MISNPRLRLLFAALLCIACSSCDSRSPQTTATSAPAQTSQSIPSTTRLATVASLAPAATDLIVGMGAGNHLVAISNFDFDRPGMPPLPHVGDYQNTDWERLSDLRPAIIIVQMEPSRIPAGFRDRAAGIGAGIVDIRIENLADIGTTLDQLGVALNEAGKAAAAKSRLNARLGAVSRAVAGEPAVRTFISLGDQGAASAGPGTFLDEVLTIAGGKNVLAASPAHWPSIDKEQLMELAPDAVVQMLPGASPQVLAGANDNWKNLSDLPAVAHHRIYSITDPSALTPGMGVADLAEKIAADLHPEAVERAPH